MPSVEGREVVRGDWDAGEPRDLTDDAQMVLNLIEHGMNIQAAIEAPRVRVESRDCCEYGGSHTR